MFSGQPAQRSGDVLTSNSMCALQRTRGKESHIGVCVILQYLEGWDNLLLDQLSALRSVAKRGRQDLQGFRNVKTDIGNGVIRQVKQRVNDVASDDVERQGW